ncbi:uncharacterized protein BDCG_03296 [Blastomyces dermatitidis ER-3]|uniref:FAD-binding FR-type domain-containing protein n=1 Tax=Ajellomyces dermatitidis (strain ER-3 / ATCC MYA-2586) TaxID=559297 RepID=A0ABP2EWP6_AJEDR|nr:uncharacterized protein BDCG_03296 [Blastomyces dermatitidis ER-3]EEQ88176.2 hypothetical protein BDCG_03296 [Blastomyces dermatitidis ER-3]
MNVSRFGMKIRAVRTMNTGLPHKLRTAQEPRQNMLYKVRLSSITQANPTVRLLRLAIGRNPTECESNHGQSRPFHFLPGQWLDVHVPSVPQAGGFTITSTPSDALPPVRDSSNNEATAEPYIELAVQESPSNPPAAWLWRPGDEILGQELAVRVGGSFIWPPHDVLLEAIGRVVFVAGGVGINPLISMISHIFKNPSHLPHSPAIHLLYSTRLPTTPKAGEDISKHLDQILFFPRLRSILDSQRPDHHTNREEPSLRLHFHLYITNLHGMPHSPPTDFTLHNRRIQMPDLHDVFGGKRDVVPDGYSSKDPGRTVCYICGPPDMTDEFVAGAEEVIGAGVGRKKSVFCEKWW